MKFCTSDIRELKDHHRAGDEGHTTCSVVSTPITACRDVSWYKKVVVCMAALFFWARCKNIFVVRGGRC